MRLTVYTAAYVSLVLFAAACVGCAVGVSGYLSCVSYALGVFG